MQEFHNVRCLQFELWQNCNNHCKFCYLNKNRINSTEQEMLKAMNTTIEILDDMPKEYNAVGLIGGEFFQGQLSTKVLRDTFIKLLQKLAKLLDGEQISQVWITASLMQKNLDEIIDILKKSGIDKKKLLICTSYDTCGRFENNDSSIWYSNLKELKQLGYILHTQTILTSDFIEEALNTNILEKISQYSMIDFKTPTIFRDDYYDVCFGKENKSYRDIVEDNKKNFNTSFFIKDRSMYLKFLQKVYNLFGPMKIKALCSNEVRSDKEYLLSKDVILDGRWSKEGVENAPCGHPWDSYCYTDSDKCARCDARDFLDVIED